MADLIMLVPTRGRPHTAVQLAQAFSVACTARTRLVLAVDDDDPELDEYRSAVTEAQGIYADTVLLVQKSPGNMATALNMATQAVLANEEAPQAIGFMGDDHRPRSHGWDTRYLGSLTVHPGIVYGNDLIHGENLPTQFAVSYSIVKALGFLSPPGLKHMYIDNYWRDIGKASYTLTYRSDVTVEHMHPVANKNEYDEGYERVNAPEVFSHDAAVYEQYMDENKDRDVELIKGAVSP